MDITIWVVDTRTGERFKPNNDNTFFDELGELQGIQEYLKIEYEIKL
ncbi:hypothetical protein [Caloranaerobacter sp. DY30410]